MSTRLPPRYLPTLTEVVDLQDFVRAAVAPASAESAMAPLPVYAAAPVAAAPDKQALAQQLIKRVKPQLEAELRSIVQELFDAQFSALLPALHLHIEEAVREAIEQALPEILGPHN